MKIRDTKDCVLNFHVMSFENESTVCISFMYMDQIPRKLPTKMRALGSGAGPARR